MRYGRSEWHDHHALQIALALDGTCMLRSQADGTWSQFQSAIVHSHRRHPFKAEGATMAQLLIEPETVEGWRAGAATRGAARRLSHPDRQRQWRIDKAIAHIRSQSPPPFTREAAAAAAAPSPGRFRHLFVAQTGMSFRAYVIWTRLNAASQFAMAGRSWTEAAHAPGFADSSHLTRMFRRMFGMNPAALCRANCSSTPCVQVRRWDRRRHSHHRSARAHTRLA